MKKISNIILLIMLIFSSVSYAVDLTPSNDEEVSVSDNMEYNFQMPDMADTIKAFQTLQKELDDSTTGIDYKQMFSAAEKDMTDIEGMTELLKSSAQMKKTQQNILSKMKQYSADGNMGAQFQLGMTYGAGVINYKESVKWLKKAAEKGHRGAEYILGFMYGYGDGVKKDIKEAKKWLLRASNKGHKEAKKYLDEINAIK